MKVVVFGASGKVGQKVVAELLGRGHEVRAFTYGTSPFDPQANLQVVTGDVKDLIIVKAAIKDQDAVISTLGSWGTKTKDILSEGMKNIIPAMDAFGVKRIVSLTGADARSLTDKPSLINKLTRPFLKLVAPKILADGEKHIELLAMSDLDWTVIRSPVMNEKGDSGYWLANEPTFPWQTINRDSVVAALVDVAESGGWSKQAPIIFRTK